MADSLLDEPWRLHRDKPDVLIGKWSEDGKPYEITVPPALREQLQELQNVLSAKRSRQRRLQAELRQTEQWFTDMFSK